MRRVFNPVVTKPHVKKGRILHIVVFWTTQLFWRIVPLNVDTKSFLSCHFFFFHTDIDWFYMQNVFLRCSKNSSHLSNSLNTGVIVCSRLDRQNVLHCCHRRNIYYSRVVLAQSLLGAEIVFTTTKRTVTSNPQSVEHLLFNSLSFQVLRPTYKRNRIWSRCNNMDGALGGSIGSLTACKLQVIIIKEMILLSTCSNQAGRSAFRNTCKYLRPQWIHRTPCSAASVICPMVTAPLQSCFGPSTVKVFRVIFPAIPNHCRGFRFGTVHLKLKFRKSTKIKNKNLEIMWQ